MNLARIFWDRLGQDETRLLFERLEPSGEMTWQQTRGALLEDASRLMAALQTAGIRPLHQEERVKHTQDLVLHADQELIEILG